MKRKVTLTPKQRKALYAPPKANAGAGWAAKHKPRDPRQFELDPWEAICAQIRAL